MFTTITPIELKKEEWDNAFREAMAIIDGLPDAEPAAISLHLPSGKKVEDQYAKAVIVHDKREDFNQSSDVLHAYEWRKRTLAFFMDSAAQALWRDNCEDKDLPALDALLAGLNTGENLHLCTTPNLIFILNHVLPRMQRCLFEARAMREGWWFMWAAKEQRNALNKWAAEKAEALTRIEQAIAWVLLGRLEAGFARGVVTYDDGVAYAASEMANRRLIHSKIDPKTNEPLPLLPVYQRHDLKADVYGEVLTYLHTKTDDIVATTTSVSHKKSLTPLQERFLALPLFQRGYVSSKGETSHVVSTTILVCDGKIQVVPTKLQKYIPRSTQFLPHWLFQGTHLRANFFLRHADLVAQLSTPLPVCLPEAMETFDKKALLQHPTLTRLQKERLLIEQAILDIEKEQAGLSWYQEASKTLLHGFLKELKNRLEQCTQQEAKWLATISDRVRGDADILTCQAVNTLKNTLESAHQAYQCCEKYAEREAEQTRVKEGAALVATLDETIAAIQRDCSLSLGTDRAGEPTVLDRLKVEAFSLAMAADAAKEIRVLLLSSAYADQIDEKAHALLERISNSQWVPPALVLATFNPLSLMLTIKSVQPLQNRVLQLLQAKSQEAHTLREQQDAFQALHQSVLRIAQVAHVPPTLLDQFLTLSQEPEKVSLEEKKCFLEQLSHAATSLRAQGEEYRAYANACVEKSVETMEASLNFYHQCHTLHALLSEPAYSFLHEKLLSAWRHAFQAEGSRIEPLHSLMREIASALNQTIARHNETQEGLQSAYLALKPQLVSLEKTLTKALLTASCRKAYQECCKFHARLEREELTPFVLPASRDDLSKTNAAEWPLSFAKEWSTRGITLTQGSDEKAMIPAMEALARQACCDFAKLTSLLSEETEKNQTTLSAVADELIRLGHFIQLWGTPTEHGEVAHRLDNLFWSYCQRWRTQEVTAGSNLRLHHRCSEPQERVLIALLGSEKSQEVKALVTKRKGVLDPKSAAQFSDACHEYQRQLVTRRQDSLDRWLTVLSDLSLRLLPQVAGCLYLDRFQAIRDHMIANDITVMTDPRLPLHKSEQNLFGIEVGYTVTFFPSTVVTKEALLVMLMEASVLFSRERYQLIHTPLLTLRDIEEKEAASQRKLSALPPAVWEKLAIAAVSLPEVPPTVITMTGCKA